MASPVGYFQLLRLNPSFRRLWLADVVSLCGDWFANIALFAMAGEYSGSGQAVGGVYLCFFVPQFLFAAFAGVVADRFPRRTIMLACDSIRALVVLSFLFADAPGRLPLMYALIFALSTASTFHEPAAQAAAGTVVERDHLVTANTLQGITWSAMLALGGLLGGLVSAAFGRRTSFVVDAASFLLSASFVLRAVVPRPAVKPAPTRFAESIGLVDLREGLRYLGTAKAVRRIVFAKAGWGIAGGAVLLLYVIYAKRLFPMGSDGTFSLGLFFGARGLGALLGPLVARRIGGDGEPFLLRAIGVSYGVIAIAYGGIALAPTVATTAFAMFLSHCAISTMWVFSSSLLNLRVPSGLRGRTFATENAAFTLALTISTLACGWALDHTDAGPRVLVAIAAGVTAITTICWWTTTRVEATAQAAVDPAT